MASLVRISEAASLGLHTMGLLAGNPRRQFTNQELAAILQASSHHLAKVMRQLVRAGLVLSATGPQGGFRMARPPSQVRLLDVYEAIEGPLPVGGCLLKKPLCRGEDCVLGDLVRKVDHEIRQHLTKTTLAAMSKRMALVRLERPPAVSVGRR
jgi:Rrf2 family protein